MANENSVPADITASAPLVSPTPEPSGNPVGNPRLAAVIARATGQPAPVDPNVPNIQPLPVFQLPDPNAAPITLPEGTEYQEAGGPVALPEGTEYNLAPKNLSEAHALGQPFNPITDFDANGLAEAAKQKAFNPVDLFMQSPLEVQNDPAIRDKVADAFMQVWQYSEKHPLEGINGKTVVTAIAHLGKGIFDWAKNHIDVVTSAAGGDKQDAMTKAAENILELQLAGTQLGYQGEDLAKWLARRVFKENIVKPLSAYSPQEKDKALQDEIDRRHLTQRILSGKTLDRVEKEGLKVNAEKIASMAGADPLQFLAFEGAGTAVKSVGKLVPELGEAANMVTEAASKAAPKIAGKAITGVGKGAEVAAKPVELAAKAVESTPGEYIAAHILGPPGVLAAKAIGKAGKALPKIAKAGTNIGEQLTEGVTSNTAQAVKDVLEAAPYALKDVLSGAAYDAAFSAAAKSPEEREGIGLGTALGLAGGASRLALHGIGGQLVGERKGAFTPRDAQLFHDTYGTGYEHHQFPDAATAKAGLEKLGLSPEEAAFQSQQRGGILKDQKVTFSIGADATPHEPIHAWKESLPAEEQAQLDKATRSRYTDEEFQQLKDKYASALDPQNFNGKNADEILKNRTKTESPDQYVINEIQAENLMTALKAGPGKGLLNKAAKITAKVLSAVGVEPLATRVSQSEALQFPLKHKEVEGLKTALEASKPPGGEGLAKEKEASRNVEGLAEKFPDKAASIGTLAEAQGRGTGVNITYAAAPGETPADVQSASPLSGRKARAAAVEAGRDLPNFARQPWWKTFFPDRTFATKKGKLQTGGWAPEIFRANAYRFAKEAAPHDQMRNLSPYEIDQTTGFYTPKAWEALTADVQTAVKNWQDGRTASGTPVVVPEELARQSGGQIYQPRVGPGGGPLDQVKADFISHLMGHQLPETPRLAKSFPLNVAGQDVSEATIPGRVGGPSRGEFGTYGQSKEEMVSQRERAKEMGVQGRQLLEVNPFRLKLDAAAKAAGVKSPKPLSTYQKLNHERILRIEHDPNAPAFRGNTLTQAAGFEPRTGREFDKFFSDVAGGKFGKSNIPFKPIQDMTPVKAADEAMTRHGGNFADHIKKSIPMLHEAETKFVDATVKTFGEGAKMLDVGSSEGYVGKSVTELSGGKIKSLSLDPNQQMADDFHKISKVPGADFTQDAFLNGFTDNGKEYPAHNPDPHSYDVIHEKMTFQFIDPDRESQIAEVKRLLKPDGVFASAQKFKTQDWAANEAKKDTQYKPQFFNKDELAEKEKRVGFQQSKEEEKAVGMMDNMVTDTSYEDTLKKHFKHVVQYWDSGNFKAYAASDDAGRLHHFVANIGDLNSDYSTVKTPRDVQHKFGTTASFEPATKAGKEAEKKGLVFKLQDFGGGTMELSLETPEGDSVSSLSASQTGPKYAQVDSVLTKDGYKKQGLAEALYRELGKHLQSKGVKVLGGLTVGDAPRRLREKVFGPPIQETRLNSAPGMDFRRTHSAVRPEAQFEPAGKAGAEGKDVAKAEKAWIEKDVKSPYFKKWFGDSKVVDAEGNPKIVYHGTTHEFDQFSGKLANVENDLGRGHYFTDEAYDASDNYAGLGPDLKNRVEQRAEEIEGNDDNIGSERAKRQAMDELVGGADRTIEAYLKLENPAVLKKNGGTTYEMSFDEDTGEESGDGVDLYNSIMRVAPRFGVDGQELWGKVFTGDEITARSVYDAVKSGDFYPEDRDTGRMAYGEMIREIFHDFGHDGIILHNAEDQYKGMNLPEDTTHYVAFDATQVKAATNRGTFSPTDARYNFEPVKFNTKEIAADIWKKAKEGGGFTYNPYSRKFLTTGYSASIYPDAEISQIIEPKALTQSALEDFIDERKHLLTRAENSIGGWLDPESGRLYLDVSFTTPSRPLAEFAGREYNQKAIGDLAKYAAGEVGEIPTGGTGEPTENPPPAHTRVDELLKDFDWEQPAGEAAPVQELMPGLGSRAPLTSKEVGEMTKAELLRHYPEAIVPKRRKDLIDYDIKNAPRWKGKENATDIAADELEKFSRARLGTQEFQDGLKWYSEFVPMLKRAYGKNHEMMAQLLAATSPRNSPQPNFALANDAIEGYKAGRFDKQIKKYLDGAKMLDSGTWQSWYAKQRKAGKLIKPRDNPSEAAFMAEWIEAHNLAPRQSNGKLYGMHSVPVLQVMAGKWLTENTGPKTLQFVKNLLGVHNGATIDVWAARTMRRLGHEGISDRWRIIPGNETGVNENDFHFSQEAFAKAASRIGVKPDALQGALWFAEKKLWAERGWGRLDFGDFRKEIAKREMLNQGIQKRLAESATSTAKQESLLDLLTPRNERR